MKKDITGKKYNMLTAIKHYDYVLQSNGKKEERWVFECDCGRKVVCRVSNIIYKGCSQKSCGCYREKNPPRKKNGLSHSRIYSIWRHMINRCYDIKNDCYKNYGGRGITVCKEWRDDLLAFKDWADKNGYKDSLTIDRIDNNGDYCPENCRWVTMKEQSRNKRTNRTMLYNGKKRCVSELCEVFCVRPGIIRNRLYRGATLNINLFTKGNKCAKIKK